MTKRATELVINMRVDNAAFDDENEISRLLNIIGARLATGDRAGKIVDINGNRVGKFEITR